RSACWCASPSAAISTPRSTPAIAIRRKRRRRPCRRLPPAATMPDNPRQLPLELVHAVGRSRDELVVGAANADAVALVDRWPDWPAPVVVLAGPAGSGKSHLAEIWRERSGAAVFSRGHLGPAAVEAAATGPVLVDDADAPGLDETGLFHLINAVRTAGTHLLL